MLLLHSPQKWWFYSSLLRRTQCIFSPTSWPLLDPAGITWGTWATQIHHLMLWDPEANILIVHASSVLETFTACCARDALSKKNTPSIQSCHQWSSACPEIPQSSKIQGHQHGSWSRQQLFHHCWLYSQHCKSQGQNNPTIIHVGVVTIEMCMEDRISCMTPAVLQAWLLALEQHWRIVLKVKWQLYETLAIWVGNRAW